MTGAHGARPGRRPVRRQRGALLASGMLCVALAGCAPSPQPEVTGDPLNSPLSRYLAAVTGFDDPDWRQEKADEAVRLEESVAQCMADEGFDYVPTVQRVVYTFDRGAAYDPDDPGWVAAWGYGVVRDPAGEAGEAGEGAAAEADPNAEYVAGLSAAEQSAYSDALIGADPSGGGGIGPDAAGCYGDAYREVHGDDATLGDEHEAITAALQEFFATQFEAPEYAEIDADWANCMADAEHGGFTRQGDAEQSIRDAFSTSPGDADSFEALHEREIDLATVDLSCRDDTDYRQRVGVVQAAQEEQFIADHRSELDSLVADAQTGG